MSEILYMSNLYVPTLKEDPADAEIASHKLLMRAGMIRKVASGIYAFLPLGMRVLQKVENIVREEMNGWTALENSRAQVEAMEQSLRIAGENLDISTYSYGEGLATILDVLQAQLSWIQLYTNAIKAHYNYAVAVSDYRRITAQQ